MQVYVITNLVNGKRYVGQTRQGIERRFNRHCWLSEKRKHMPIDLAIAKYGREKFGIEIVETCSTQEELNEREKFWAYELGTFAPLGYNLKAGDGRGSVSMETRLRIGAANRGKKVSQETRQRLSESHKGFRVSEETKRKLSERHRGRLPSIATRAGASDKNSRLFRLINPQGLLVIIKNMRRFCREHRLQPSNMCELTKGRLKSYKGWTNP